MVLGGPPLHTWQDDRGKDPSSSSCPDSEEGKPAWAFPFPPPVSVLLVGTLFDWHWSHVSVLSLPR